MVSTDCRRWRQWQVVKSRPSTSADLPAGPSSPPAAASPGSPSPASCRCTIHSRSKTWSTLDDALKYGARAAKARFAVYIGELGEDPAAAPVRSSAKVPTPDNAVLLAVSPNQRAIEVVYGEGVKGRGIEGRAARSGRGRRLFKDGNLMDGLISASAGDVSAGISPR